MKNYKSILSMIIASFTFSTKAIAQLPEEYQTLLADEKQEALWSNVEAEPYEELPGFVSRLFLQAIGSTALLQLDKTMTHSSDEMPEGRIKFIHTYGSCAKAEFVITQKNSYTGLFQTGAPALIRLGWAAPPQVTGYIPGMAVKLFIDGKASRNLQVMRSLDGQGDNQNYFQNTFSNILPPPEGTVLKVLSSIFKTVSTNPLELTLDHLANVGPDGKAIKKFKAPRKLLFEPTPQAQLPNKTTKDLREQLSEEFNPGTVLYRVYAIGEGRGPIEGLEPKLIGKLVLRSDFVASEYCDKNVFFQHTDTFLKK